MLAMFERKGATADHQTKGNPDIASSQSHLSFPGMYLARHGVSARRSVSASEDGSERQHEE